MKNTRHKKVMPQELHDSGDKRQHIIAAALEIISSKGGDASISEIAALAEINESTIYRYFKNKEDLLFYAAAECLRQKTEELKIQLGGIREPISRLSKLIWCLRLYNESKNDPYVKFDLFECRGKETYHKHEAFKYFIRFAMTTEEILRDGVRQGVFWHRMNIPIARDMICGFLEMENIQYYLDHRLETGPDEFDDVMDLVLHMFGEKSADHKKSLGKRAAILEAAERLFAAFGYQNATTIEIAKSAGVVEATLYEYFKGKEDILFTDLQDRLKAHLLPFCECPEIQSATQRFRTFVSNFFLSLLGRPSFAKVLIADGIYNIKFYKTAAYDHFRRYLGNIDEILKAGEDEGCFRPGIKPHIIKNLLLGVFCTYTLRTMFFQDCRPQNLLEEIEATVSLLVRAVVRSEKQQ